jgi:SulP family sulfate permease
MKPGPLLRTIVPKPATQKILQPYSAKLHFDRAELAGAVADLGVLVPIAVMLIVKDGLSPTAVLLPAGLLYVAAGLIYRLPVPVQPLKAFGAIAIAQGFGSAEIAAGALLMGAIFVAFGVSGLLDRIAKIFPVPIIRGVQFSVGLIFCQLAWKLITAPPAAFPESTQPTWWLAGATMAVILAGLLVHRRTLALVLVALATVAMVLGYQGTLNLVIPRPSLAASRAACRSGSLRLVAGRPSSRPMAP